MGFEDRADRWPSSWEMMIAIGDRGPAKVEVRNVSRSGLKCAGATRAEIGDRIALEVMHHPVRGEVVRKTPETIAIAFDRPLSEAQLNCLRQFRRLPQGAPARNRHAS